MPKRSPPNRRSSSLPTDRVDDRGGDRRSPCDADYNPTTWESEAGRLLWPIRQRAQFAALSEPKREHLLESVSNAVDPVGATVYEEDASASADSTISCGLLKPLKSAHSGQRIVRLLGPDTALGLEALSSGLHRHTAVALRPTELCGIPQEVVQDPRRRDEQLADPVLSQWEPHLESADRWLAELAQGTVSERLRRLMVILVDM